MSQLGRSRTQDNAALAEIASLLAKRQGWLQQIGKVQEDAASGLEEGEWEGALSIAVIDHVDDEGDFSAPDLAYLVAMDGLTLRAFPLGPAPDYASHGDRVRVRGVRSADRIVAEQIDVLAIASDASSKTPLGDPAPLSCESTGPQRGIVIAVNYRDHPTARPSLATIHDRHFGERESLRDYWREASYGKIDLTGDSFGWYTLNIDSAQACSVYLVRNAALARAALDTDLTQYNRVFIVMQDPVPACDWTALASISCSNLATPDGDVHASYSVAFSSWYHSTRSGLWISAHEGGHNLGLLHAPVRDYGANSIGPIGGFSLGELVDSGDRFDAMGGRRGSPCHYSAAPKNWLGWLSDPDLVALNGDGELTIGPMASPLGTIPKAARLFRGVDPASFEKEYLWLEMRQPLGYDAFMDSRGFDGILVHHRNSGTSERRSENLDLHPDTATGDYDYFDAPLYPDESFTDPYGGITLTYRGLDPDGNAVVDVSVDPALFDSDEDGVSDSVESAYGTNPDLEDTDADGLTDYQEACFDGDCSNYDPHPGGVDLDATDPDTDGDALPDLWEAEHALDPLVSNGDDDPDADGLSNRAEFDHGTNPHRPDTDRDGLTDGDEVNHHGTDAGDPDTDGDGMRDGWEITNGLDPIWDDGTRDPDTDGLTNIDEWTIRTDPNDPDTDADGLRDGDEVNAYLTDPKQVDTDGDTLTDGDEVNVHDTDPLSAVDGDNDGMPDDWESARGTNPTANDARLDADGDGIDNAIEFLRRTLPLDPDSTALVKSIYLDASSASAIEDGTQANPYTLLESALNVAQDGDTIFVAGGTYSTRTGLYTKSVDIIGPPDRSAIISVTGSRFQYGQIWGGCTNLTITATESIWLLWTRNFIFRRCRIRALSGTNVTSNSHVEFVNSLLQGSGESRGIYVGVEDSVTLINSTIVGFPIGVLAEPTAGIAIHNSILSNAVDLSGVADGSGISYTLISDGQLAGSNGNIDGDPLFVDTSGGDYHLQAGSPAIDAGGPAGEFASEPEPNGCRRNLGAFGGTSEAATSGDPDADGLAGYCETLAGTDPKHPDTDHDGLLDGADSNPLDLFSPNPEGLNLARDADFADRSAVYGTTDTLHILTWSAVVGSNAKDASCTARGGEAEMTGPLTDHGDGSYSDSVLLEDLNYVGADVSISTRLKRKKREFLASQTIEIYAALGCDDGLDNDGDSLIDVDDPGCTSPADPTETDAALVCDDGADNDGDALIDTADPGCSDALDRSEGLALLASESHCAAEQMKRGAQFCEAAFSCWRRYVRNPAKNRLNACLAKREATFASRHGKAIRKAAGRGRRCRLEDPVTYFLDAAFVQPMQAILHDIIGASMPARISPHEATLRATVLDAAGRLCAQRLQAESGQATKPRRARIESRRKKARERFESQVAKALRKAAKKGVPEPQMDPQMIGDAAERMADAFAEEVRAVESGD